VVTQEGDSRRYHATATVRYRPAAAKHFGPSIYDSHSYFNRPYMDPAVCYTGTRNGAWDDFTRRQYPNFEGWNAVSYKTLTDANAWNDLTPDGAKRLYEWQLRRQGDITKPDYVLDTGLGGPIPLLGARLGHARFFLTHFREQDMFIFPLSRDAYTDNHTQLKITSDLTSSIKLTLTGLYGEVRSVSPYDWTTTPTGYVLRDQEEIADLVNSSSGKSILYMPGYYSPSDIFRSMVGVQWTHMLSSKTFYEISAQFQSNKYNTFQTAMRDTTRSFQPVPGYYTDESPNGYWGYSVSAIDGTSMGGWMNLGRDASLNTTSNFRFDMTSQLNARSQLKAGWQLTYNDFDIKSSTYSPSMNTWTRSMFYNVFPFRIGAYLQDKLEFEGFIANLGVRLDYSNPNTTEYSVSTFDKNLSAGYGKTLEESVDQNDVQPELYWSPRLGVSHPITENSKLYFNYGHFRSEPFSSYRFRLQRESNGLVTYLGNPNLRMEKTVAYELGWSQSLFSQYLLNIAAYYKDVSNQPGWIYYANINSSVQYYKASNNNYADIRGVECTLTKTMGRWLSGFMNYTYHVSTSGYFDLLNYFQDPNRQRDYLRQNPTQSRPRPQPFARTNIDVHTPSQWGPSWLGMHPLADWNLNILAYWRKGRYETYNPNKIAGITDDVQWRDWHNLDLRISKTWRRGAGQLQLYLDINNILNTRYMSMAGFSDTYDYLYYLESLNFSWESGEQRGQDRVGDFRPAGVAYDPLEPNPTNDQAITARNNKRKETRSYIDMPNLEAFSFLNPRDVTFGVRINF
jgi:outer membrane receptor protein involved in Fe transport